MCKFYARFQICERCASLVANAIVSIRLNYCNLLKRGPSSTTFNVFRKPQEGCYQLHQISQDISNQRLTLAFFSTTMIININKHLDRENIEGFGLLPVTLMKSYGQLKNHLPDVSPFSFHNGFTPPPANVIMITN